MMIRILYANYRVVSSGASSGSAAKKSRNLRAKVLCPTGEKCTPSYASSTCQLAASAKRIPSLSVSFE